VRDFKLALMRLTNSIAVAIPLLSEATALGGRTRARERNGLVTVRRAESLRSSCALTQIEIGARVSDLCGSRAILVRV
jgi:hypothetical protein